MDIEVGCVYEGIVKSIAAFGAFVMLPDGRTGLVHISEIADTYVADVADHLKEGQTVMVKVTAASPGDKLKLSIKSAAAPAAGRPRLRQKPQQPQGEPTFEDKLKQFMKSSEGKIADMNRQNNEKRGISKRRR